MRVRVHARRFNLPPNASTMIGQQFRSFEYQSRVIMPERDEGLRISWLVVERTRQAQQLVRRASALVASVSIGQRLREGRSPFRRVGPVPEPQCLSIAGRCFPDHRRQWLKAARVALIDVTPAQTAEVNTLHEPLGARVQVRAEVLVPSVTVVLAKQPPDFHVFVQPFEFLHHLG